MCAESECIQWYNIITYNNKLRHGISSLTASSLVIVVVLLTVDPGDEGVAGEVVAHGDAALGLVPVYPGVETAQTPGGHQSGQADQLSESETEDLVFW